MSTTLIQEGLIALKEIAQGPRPNNRPEPRLDPVSFFDKSKRPRRKLTDKKSITIGQDLNIARPDKFDNSGRLLRKGTPGLDLKQKLGGDISGTYIIPNYGKGPGVGR